MTFPWSFPTFLFEVFSLKKRSLSVRCPSIIIYSNMTEKGRNEHEVSVG